MRKNWINFHPWGSFYFGYRRTEHSGAYTDLGSRPEHDWLKEKQTKISTEGVSDIMMA